jgi:hypothetical protein
MKQFLTIDGLIEARAQAQHHSNLNYGGLSDIEVERRVAARRGTGYVHANHATHTLGIELSEGALSARYIKNFGYVEFG